MTDDLTDPVLLARDIANGLEELTGHLSQAGPQQAALILETVLGADVGVLDRLTTLLATASHYTRAAEGTFSPELCLALGLAANTLDDISFDLDEHGSEIHRRATTAAASRADGLPATQPTARASAPAPARAAPNAAGKKRS